MEPTYVAWSAMITVGAILGVFFRPKVAGIIIFTLLVLSIGGALGAVFLQLIRPEWMLLLIGAGPVAAIIFGAAVASNVVVGAVKRWLAKH